MDRHWQRRTMGDHRHVARCDKPSPRATAQANEGQEMIAHITAWLQARRAWRTFVAVFIGAVGVLWAWTRHRAKSRDAANQAADDRVVQLAEDVVIANATAVAEIKAVKAADLERRAEIVAAATDPDRAARLAKLAKLLGDK